MEIDSILDKLGRIGKFQILMYVFCGLQGISFPVWDMLSVTSFMAPSPEYSCSSWQSEDENGGKSMEYVTNFNHSVYNGECEDGEEIVFNLDTYGRTLVTEWQLVGDKAVLVELSQSLFMVGMMVGSIVLGQMSDSFGRKPILIMCASLSPLLGLASGFVPNMWFFISIRILIGFICPGAILTSYVLALELFPSKKRAAASILLSSFNAIAYVGLAMLAFFIKDWRYLQITTSAFRILLVPFCLFVPESIQWLAAKGKHEKLEQLLQQIATVNKIDISFPILADVNKSDQIEDGTTLNRELSTSESDLPQKESDKSDEDRLFMYDSAVSLDDRDYIPAEDNYSLDNYSSDSETEEAAHFASGNLSVSRSSASNLPSTYSARDGLSYPGHCERVNLYPVNSSISILSELREESELLASYDDIYQQRPSATQIPCVPKKTLEMSQEPHTNKPLRKKSVSLCHIPSFVTFESEIHGGGRRVVRNKLSPDHHMKENFNVMKTVSIPNITVNSVEGAAVPEVEAACSSNRGTVHGSKVNRKPANLTITTNEHAGSSFLLSVPTLALPFGYSQNLFPNVGNQYDENVESSQSEGEDWIRDDTSGFNSSTSNVGHLSDYESLEEGFGKKQGKDGYSELKKSTTEDNKTVKKERVKKAYTALDLFRMSSVRLITVSSMTIWFATYSVYVGLSMSTDALAGDPYINFSLVGLVEIPAVIVAALSAVRIGRRFPSGVFHFLTALSCCVYLVLPTENGSTWSSMISVVAILFAKCFTSAAYNVECLLTAEVLPTPLSTTAFASVQTLSIEVTDKLAKTTSSSSSSAFSIWWSSRGCITFITAMATVIG